MTTSFGAQALAMDGWGAGIAMRSYFQSPRACARRRSTGQKIIAMFCLSALVPLGETTLALQSRCVQAALGKSLW